MQQPSPNIRKPPMSQEEIQAVFDTLKQSSRSTANPPQESGYGLRTTTKPLTWVYLDNGTGHIPQ